MQDEWTEQRVERLKKLWADGFSASQIAADLGHVTRSAVLGKISRLKLPARYSAAERVQQRINGAARRERKLAIAAAPRPAPAVTPMPQPRRSKPGRIVGSAQATTFANPPAKPVAADDIRIPPQIQVETRLDAASTSMPTGRGVKFDELTPFTCRWPLGDVGTPEFEFCGHVIGAAGPYCGPHTRMAYQTPAARQRQTKWALLGAEQKS